MNTLEIRRIFKISIPIVLAQVGQMTMGLVDTLVVGQIGPAAQGGVGAANAIFWGTVVFGMGTLSGLDPLISQANGAGKRKECYEYFFQGFWVALVFSLILVVFVKLAQAGFVIFDPEPVILENVRDYLDWIVWSLFPIFIFTVFQRFWQSLEIVKPLLYMMILANIINAFADYALVLGKFGFPQLGAKGVALSTLFTRGCLLFVILAYSIYMFREKNEYKLHRSIQSLLRFQKEKIKEILKIGFPAGGQVFIEMMAFGLVTLLATKLGPEPLAAHHIVLSMASFSFMFPLGLSSAAAVRVGTLYGALKTREALQAGNYCLWIGGSFMAMSALTMILFGRPLLGLFTNEGEVIDIGVKLLYFAIAFQIFDGIQITGTGCLRGLSNSRSPFLANLIGHYPMGLLIGSLFCFYFKWGVYGLWLGYATGLSTTASLILYSWRKQINPGLRE